MKERNEISKRTKPESRKSRHIKKSLIKKVIPYILVGCITSSAVMMSYTEAREVKAVAVVDDIILLTALLAMGGIAYVCTTTQWEEDTEENEELSERIAHQWNWNLKQKGVLLGYIDPETGEYIGALEGTGGNTGGGGDDDNDNDKNKFPTWQKLKEWVALNNGNIPKALGSGAGLLIGTFAATMLASSEEGAKMPGGLPTEINTALHDMDNAYGKYLDDNKILISEYPYSFTSIVTTKSKFTLKTSTRIETCYFKSGDYCAYILPEDSTKIYQGFSNKDSKGITVSTEVGYNPTVKNALYASTLETTTPSLVSYKFYGDIPVTRSYDESMAFYDNPYPVYPDRYINPSTVGKSTALAKKLAETGGDLTKSLYENAALPTTEQLNQYFEDLNNAEDEEEKQKIMDEFVDSLVNPTENPNPNPNPENPDNPVPPDNPENPTNNDTFLADLKHLFPFCIPFDLVDCFKLFNAEPVTPRMEFPVHFGIINYDHTFVIDLKDFNNVAVVCRSTFLIIYMTGLILATRALIKG